MATLPISSGRINFVASGHAIAAIRLWVRLAFAGPSGIPAPLACLLDTGAPLCVVPYFFQHTQQLAWQPLSGPWPAGFNTWFGVPCTIGRVEVWVPTQQPPFLHGPFSLIAKFAQTTPQGLPSNLPILLG